ncbi:hypothetical protein ABZ951_01305 [Streptomyces sp. NPDC046215]|uniref:Secreted protein n=1 Tax=Streptomyces stramineus TaxID=173861 RepID=A0ABN1B9T8_9ACTN
MSTSFIITLVAVAAVVVIGFVLALRAVGRGGGGGRGLRRRFGPEYDVAVARHGGDGKAAERDLTDRLRRHKDLRLRPLPAADREQYAARWAGIQEQFVDAPGQAVTDAGLLLGNLARDRGFPAGSRSELTEALSVHHPRTVGGLREIDAAAVRSGARQARTEELREALVRARALFEDLVAARPEDRHAGRRHGGGGLRHARHDQHVRKEGV